MIDLLAVLAWTNMGLEFHLRVTLFDLCCEILYLQSLTRIHRTIHPFLSQNKRACNLNTNTKWNPNLSIFLSFSFWHFDFTFLSGKYCQSLVFAPDISTLDQTELCDKCKVREMPLIEHFTLQDEWRGQMCRYVHTAVHNFTHSSCPPKSMLHHLTQVSMVICDRCC